MTSASLALWLTPVNCLHVPPLHPGIAAYLIGEARLIRCRFGGCTNTQQWETGRETMLALLSRWRITGLEEFWGEAEQAGNLHPSQVNVTK